MTALTPHLCERGPRCLAAIRDQDELVPAPSDRPLCDVCERAVARALDEAPETYVRLRIATRTKTVAAPSEQVTLSKGSPMPLNGRALDLGEQLWWLLTTWEDEVRLIARLTYAERTGKREGPQVAEAATLLADHLTAWICAPSVDMPMTRTSDNGTFTYHRIEQSGAEAACALLDWRAAVRRLPGLDTQGPRAIRRYQQPCPNCGVRAITHHAGDPLMQCQNCGATEEYLEHLPGVPEGAAA